MADETMERQKNEMGMKRKKVQAKEEFNSRGRGTSAKNRRRGRLQLEAPLASVGGTSNTGENNNRRNKGTEIFVQT